MDKKLYLLRNRVNFLLVLPLQLVLEQQLLLLLILYLDQVLSKKFILYTNQSIQLVSKLRKMVLNCSLLAMVVMMTDTSFKVLVQQ